MVGKNPRNLLDMFGKEKKRKRVSLPETKEILSTPPQKRGHRRGSEREKLKGTTRTSKGRLKKYKSQFLKGLKNCPRFREEKQRETTGAERREEKKAEVASTTRTPVCQTHAGGALCSRGANVQTNKEEGIFLKLSRVV